MKPQTVWSERNKGRTAAVTVPELYQQVEQFLRSLKDKPAPHNELLEQSETLSRALMPLVAAVKENQSMLQAQNFTLEAFALGMVRGAGDGAVLFQYQQSVEHPEFETDDEALKSSAEVLHKNIKHIAETAQNQWAKAHSDDLHLLCGYGKQENLGSLQEGGKLGVKDETSLFEFRKFLLASFKGGYATGMIQAAVIFVAGD